MNPTQQSPPPLSVGELLLAIYQAFAQEAGAQSLELPERTYSELTTDGDYHRPKSAGFWYDKALIIRLDDKNSKTWAIARGEADEAWLGRQYNSQLIAIPADAAGENLAQTLMDFIEQRCNFGRYELLCALADGNLTTHDRSVFFEKLSTPARRLVGNAIVSRPAYRDDVILLSGQPIPTHNARYSPQLTKDLVDVIKKTLSTVALRGRYL